MPKIHWEPGILLKVATKLSLPFSEYQHAKYEHEVLSDLSLAPLLAPPAPASLWATQEACSIGVECSPATCQHR